MTDIRDPEECSTMTEVRAGVDDIDRQVVALIARRFGYMDAAARIKSDRGDVRDERRKAEVISNVRDGAIKAGIDADLVAQLYDHLIESSIAHELAKFDARRN